MQLRWAEDADKQTERKKERYEDKSELLVMFNPAQPRLIQIISKNFVRTSKKTQYSWRMMFEEIISVYTDNHKKSINIKCTFTGCYRNH